jgi:hypothetical protein
LDIRSEPIDVEFTFFAFLKVLVHYLMHLFLLFEVSGLKLVLELVDTFCWSFLALERLRTIVVYDVTELLFRDERRGSWTSPDDVAVVEGHLLLQHMNVVDEVGMRKT